MEKIQQIREKLEAIIEIYHLYAKGIYDGKICMDKIPGLTLSALALLDEMEKTGVWVEIPKPLSNGECHYDCPLCNISPSKEWKYCIKRLDNDGKPGPNCPRYKEAIGGKQNES